LGSNMTMKHRSNPGMLVPQWESLSVPAQHSTFLEQSRRRRRMAFPSFSEEEHLEIQIYEKSRYRSKTRYNYIALNPFHKNTKIGKTDLPTYHYVRGTTSDQK